MENCENLQLKNELSTATSKMSPVFERRTSGTEREVGSQSNGHGGSHPGHDYVPKEKIVWRGKKGLSEGSSGNRWSLPCPNPKDEVIERANASVKIQSSLPPRYVPFKQLQSQRDSETSKCFHSAENLKDQFKLKSSIPEQHQYEPGGNARGSEDRALDKNEHKQRGNSGSSQGQASTSKKRHSNKRRNGNTRVTGLHNSRVVMSGCEFEKPAGGIVDDKKESEAFKQGNPNGNSMYLSNPKLSCGPPSRIESVYSQTSKNKALDKNEQKQRGNSVASQGQASTSIRRNGNLRMNGETKGTGPCLTRFEVRGCELDKHSGVAIDAEMENKASKQGNPNSMYLSNTKLLCEPQSRIDDGTSFSNCKTEEMEESNTGKTALEIASKEENMSTQQPQIGRQKTSFQVKRNGRHRVNNDIGQRVWKRREQVSAKTLKESKDSASIGTATDVRSNGCGQHSDLERQTDGGGETRLKLTENQDKVSEELGVGAICVSYPFPFENDRPRSVNRGRGETEAISIVNNKKTTVKLLAVKLVDSRPSYSFSLSISASTSGLGKSVQCQHKPCLSNVESLEFKIQSMSLSPSCANSLSLVGGPWLIEPGHHLIIYLSCTAKEIGLHRSSVIFDFQNQKVMRHATLLADDDVSKQLAPTEPYSRMHRRKTGSLRRFVHGVPPPLPNFLKQLDVYPIPNSLMKRIGKEVPQILEQGISMDTYSEYLSTLLHLEELQMKADISAYDMQNVTMSKVSEYLVLKVPGLSEKRPSLIYRDAIYVTASGMKDKRYQGYIYKVEADEIFLKFNKSFHKNFIPKLQYDVQFSFSRINLRRGHQAVAAAAEGGLYESFLFPHKPLAKRTGENAAKIDCFNVSLNMEQSSAVYHILNCHGSPPYLIYGPPGTGKTVTLVEAIVQILRSNLNAHILACAPSNVASDLLLERLLGPVQQREIFRLNAYSRPHGDVPSQILPYCSYKDSNFYCPPVEQLLKYQVIISTYLSAAMLDAQQVPRGHFTHIFLDESGQGTEPETMISIANLANTETTVVLAGDPQQLGPIIHSPIAERFGLGKSYLERLSNLELYSLDGDNKAFVTKLVRNYRSHPAILEIPSRLFYGSELIACAAEESRASLCHWEELPNKKFPVLFVGIEGCDEREGTSPSWFNTVEVSKVIEIIKNLKDHKRSRVTGKDIGVITPYHQQVVKLKKALAANTLSDVKVGSVEQFQGEEKRVIIISTVRSSYKYEEFDKKYNLGFLRNPKRFNVAITRAKSLLVVVGNPHILCKDKCWNELLQHCVCHKSYLGCSLPERNAAENDVLHMDRVSPSDYSVDSSCNGPSVSFKANIEGVEWPDGTR
eukprot:Gb_02746 [translate_table: standard]